jgi:hypothetical protein
LLKIRQEAITFQSEPVIKELNELKLKPYVEWDKADINKMLEFYDHPVTEIVNENADNAAILTSKEKRELRDRQ